MPVAIREITVKICQWCEYEWQPIVAAPKSCPKCKKRDP